MWAVPVAGTVAVAVLAAFTVTRPVSTADLDVPPLVASDGEFTRADPPVDVALLGDSVGVSLAKGWRGEDYPGVTLSNQARIGCDLIDAPLIAGGEPMAEYASAAE